MQATADPAKNDWRFCVAPMAAVTDRHCRYFHRLLAPRARLYTEMITTGALLHGDAAHHLAFDPDEHPVALQLGGNEPRALAHGARLAAQWGYDEVNLNCGCPSKRVRKGAFGACLMADPAHVARCVRAMQDAIGQPVTVKHRLGLDDDTSYAFVRDFVGILYEAGCRVFIVHARNALLDGLSPRQNRTVPPLRYDDVLRLKSDFPQAVIVLNGGLVTPDECLAWLQRLDGVMLGRAAWHTPAMLSALDDQLSPDRPRLDDEAVLTAFHAYCRRQHARGVPLALLLRGVLGWQAGRKGARQWRRLLSDPQAQQALGADILLRAYEAMREPAVAGQPA